MALVREMKRGASVQRFSGKLSNNNKFHEYKCTKNREMKNCQRRVRKISKFFLLPGSTE